MKTFYSRYPLVDSFNDKFHALIGPLIVILFITYFFSLVIAPLVILFIIIGVLWHYYSVDERLEIHHNGEELQIKTLGKVQIDQAIRKVYHGWSYHFPIPIKNSRNFTSFPWLTSNSRNNNSPSNVIVVNIILELSNGEIVNIHQYLNPWNEPPKGWQYVGNWSKHYTLVLKIGGGLKKLQKKLSNNGAMKP
ncbi:MAG: hypothetical protein ACI94Y_001326 [Maribacter sp.]|jgi:hypothetical protein